MNHESEAVKLAPVPKDSREAKELEAQATIHCFEEVAAYAWKKMPTTEELYSALKSCVLRELQTPRQR